MRQAMYYLILAIVLFAIYGAVNLSLAEFQEQSVCPKVLNIPACYIVLVFFILVLFAHIGKNNKTRNLFYFIFLLIPFLLALGGTITELSGTEICPRTPGGTPMCFLSLGLCSTLMVLKIIKNKIQ